ncbi:IMP dehydrogenase [Klebsiella pneumoniae subsp. pneumoniae]|nr:IMP dehydrogenase [Klebsiella pneumoniae subsp. pneumoniae]
MRIEEDLKLGFKDVLIRPKRSTLKSRSDVELEREFTFKHSGLTRSGVPIIAANMDTVGTFSMAKALATFGILTAVHKHYTAEEWLAFTRGASADVLKHVMVSTGTSDADFEKTQQIPLSEPTAEFCVYRRRQRLLRSTLYSSWRRRAKPGRKKLSSPGTWSPVKCAKS